VRHGAQDGCHPVVPVADGVQGVPQRGDDGGRQQVHAATLGVCTPTHVCAGTPGGAPAHTGAQTCAAGSTTSSAIAIGRRLET
jgi:hypothetical protein